MKNQGYAKIQNLEASRINNRLSYTRNNFNLNLILSLVNLENQFKKDIEGPAGYHR